MVAVFGTAIVSLLFLKSFVLDVGQVNGVSMEPTYVDQDRFFVNKVEYFFRRPGRQDIVQIIDPGQSKLLLKRVIGLPNETVVIKQGKVFIRSQGSQEEILLVEAYLPSTSYTTIPLQKAPQRYSLGSDEYFVLGDHREQSTDSRVYGAVHRSRILGSVMGKL